MCGFVVVIENESGDRVDVGALRAAIGTLAHRGPDGVGVAQLAQGRVAMAHARLSIVDLEGGAQPLFNEDGSLCAVVNGELYDYRSVRRALEARGHRFRTASDSELVLHLYEEYGDECTNHLQGEFAFVLWDGRTQRLFCARDAMGVKPLFYAVTPKEVVLASEAKAILAYGVVPRQIRPDYLACALAGVPNARVSPFEGIEALGPGHRLRIDDGRPRAPSRWFFHRFEDEVTSLEAAREPLRQVLRRAVRRRLIADVPVHVYLSGGLDSTLVAALMAEASAHPTAYTVSFAGTELDESSAAQATARHYGFPLEVIDARVERLAEQLPRTVYHCESVIGNLNSAAKLMLSEHVRSRGVKVCLTGEGADELFCGYAYWKVEALVAMRARGGKDAAQAKRLFARLRAEEHRNRGLAWSDWTARSGADLPFGYPSFIQRRVDGMSGIAPILLSADMRRAVGKTPSSMLREVFDPRDMRALHPVHASRKMAFELLAAYVIPNLGDRVEMANSVECRTPFLDRDVVEFALGLSPDLLVDVRQLREKHVLYESFRDLLPPHVYRTRKHPFLSPGWSAFAATKMGRDLVEALLSPRAIRDAGLFNPWAVAAIVAAFRALPSRLPQAKALDFAVGGLLSLQLLHHLFVDGGAATRGYAAPGEVHLVEVRPPVSALG